MALNRNDSGYSSQKRSDGIFNSFGAATSSGFRQRYWPSGPIQYRDQYDTHSTAIESTQPEDLADNLSDFAFEESMELPTNDEALVGMNNFSLNDPLQGLKDIKPPHDSYPTDALFPSIDDAQGVESSSPWNGLQADPVLFNMKRTFSGEGHDTDRPPKRPQLNFIRSAYSDNGHNMQMNMLSPAAAINAPPGYGQPWNASGNHLGVMSPHGTTRSAYGITKVQATPSSHPTAPAETKKRGEKRHVCQNGCSRAFGTKNDLDRHRRTAHGVIHEKELVWICDFEPCSSASKLWPRLDNFKQHITKMHRLDPSDADRMRHVFSRARHGHLEVLKHAARSQPRRPARVKSSASATGTAITSSSGNDGSIMAMGQPIARPRCTSHGQFAAREPWDQDQLSLNSIAAHGLVSSVSQRRLMTPRNLPPSFEVPRARQVAQTITNDGSAWPQDFEYAQERFQRPDPIQSDGQDLSNVGGGHQFSGNDMPPAQPDSSLTLSTPQTQGESPLLINNDKLWEMGAAWKSLTPTEREAVIKISQGDVDSVLPPQTDGNSPNKKSAKAFQCDRHPCNSSFDDQSGLNKHLRRHKKQFFCTFKHCYKRFGTKWEMKRHEKNQHKQRRQWRCCLKKGVDKQKDCAMLYDTIDELKEHMSKRHGEEGKAHIEDQKYLDDCCLQKDFLGSFWCGFCATIRQQPKEVRHQEHQKWRLDHLVEHIESGKTASDWIGVSGREREEGLDDDSPDSSPEPEEHHASENTRKFLDSTASATDNPTQSLPEDQCSARSRAPSLKVIDPEGAVRGIDSAEDASQVASEDWQNNLPEASTNDDYLDMWTNGDSWTMSGE